MGHPSDRQLKLWYTQYNKRYFNNELPEPVTLVWEPIPACHGLTCQVFETESGVFSVKIDPALKGTILFARMVLLHEMCHISVWKKHPKHQHGPVFQREKDRLYALGALKKLW